MIHANKALGQNFLTDPHYRERIARAVGVPSGGTVVEIGPGQGALTAELLSLGLQVIAIEKDTRMQAPLEALATKFPSQLTVHYQNALHTSWRDIGPTPVTLCGNLPYNIGTQLVIDALQTRGKFNRMVFLLQKEVVKRITAQASDDDWGRLALFCQLHAQCRPLFDVPPGAFTPAPKVTSSVVEIVPLAQPRLKVDEAKLEQVVKVAFGQRRKMLRASLKGLLTEAQIASTHIAPERRPETLTLEEFARLAALLEVVF